jgi:hypothetical protein
MTGAVPIIPPQFINTGVIYGAPPAPAPYPVGKALVDTETKTKLTINYIYIKPNLSNSEKSSP